MRSFTNDAGEHAEMEKSLRTAIELNPAFAPAYDLLGTLLMLERKDLNEAYRMAQHAVELDPTKVAFRMNSENILMSQGRTEDAILAMQNAMKVASTPEDAAHIQSALDMAQRYREFQQSRDAGMKSAETRVAADAPVSNTTSSTPEPPPLRRHGPKKTITGTIQQVQCSAPSAVDVQLAVGKGTLKLHSDNYYKVAFSALGFSPTGELHPCSDIQGMAAKIDYEDGTDDSPKYIVAVELHK
jgi:tetratricopeptide (TPR) repeat protein